MFGIGGSELVVIVLVALLVFGPGRIPEVVRTITAAYRELTKLKRQVGDTVSELRQEIDLKSGLQSEIVQALRPPTGARVAVEIAKPKLVSSPAGQAEGGGNAPVAATTGTGVAVAKADADDYLAPAAAAPQPAAGDSAADDYLSGERHE